MKKPSENMQAMYLKKKEDTLNKIQQAINMLQDEGKIVKKKDLMRITGLSSGTFSKEYVKNLLKENKVCQYSTLRIATDLNVISSDEQISQLMAQNNILSSKVQTMTLVLEQKNNRITILLDKNRELEQENQKLRGKCQMYLESLEVLGMDISKFPIR